MINPGVVGRQKAYVSDGSLEVCLMWPGESYSTTADCTEHAGAYVTGLDGWFYRATFSHCEYCFSGVHEG